MDRQKRIEVINSHMLEDHGHAIVEANESSGLHNLPLACALVEQESNGRNVFGCDWGPQGGKPPFCGDRVTKERVHQLLAQSKNNGVGLTQLTAREYVERANHRQGGAAEPRNQCHVGFKLLHGLLAQLGHHKGIGAYNGGPGNPIDSYADEVEAKERAWQRRLS